MRRSAVVGLLLMVVLAMTCALGVSNFQKKLPVFKNGQTLILALKNFVADCAKSGKPVPASVSLRELVNKGYITPGEVSAFNGIDVVLFPVTDETDPQKMLIKARLPDGSMEVVLADGSVQQVAR